MKPDDEFNAKRRLMVEEQLKKRGIKDPALLAAMGKVPRHRFLSEEHWDKAYDDQAIMIGPAQSISQPYVVAYMVEKLQIRKSDSVLDVGTGTGYQTAILAEVAKQVYTIEIDEVLYKASQKTTAALGYDNIKFRLAGGQHGWKEYAPFDAIIVSAAAENVPRELVSQLASGGRMILPLGTESQSLVLITKQENRIATEELGEVQFVKLQDPEDEMQ